MTALFRLLALLIFLGAAQVAAAAGGWYLLLPPTSDYDKHAEYLNAYKILDTKPLSQWAQQGAYDSASECESAKDVLLLADQNFYSRAGADYIRALGSKKEATVLELMKFTAERANANVNLWRAGLCTKSEDPRLAK